MPTHSSQLLTITPESHGVQVDVVYATDGNLTGRAIYRNAVCLIHPEADACLRTAITLAGLAGYTLKILDAYRPPCAQRAFWKLLPDPRYVADANEGSNHSRGVAVDVTLVDSEGRDLDMGTGFDAMEDASHHSYPDLPPDVQRNRFLLVAIMSQAGFRPIKTEWWHYELPDPKRFPLLVDDAVGCLDD